MSSDLQTSEAANEQYGDAFPALSGGEGLPRGPGPVGQKPSKPTKPLTHFKSSTVTQVGAMYYLPGKLSGSLSVVGICMKHKHGSC